MIPYEYGQRVILVISVGSWGFRTFVVGREIFCVHYKDISCMVIDRDLFKKRPNR